MSKHIYLHEECHRLMILKHSRGKDLSIPIHAMKGTKNSKTLFIINSIHNFELRNLRLNTNYYCNNLVIQFII